MTVEKRKMKMMNRVQLVGHAAKAMALMNSGFAVMYVRDGSMANV